MGSSTQKDSVCNVDGDYDDNDDNDDDDNDNNNNRNNKGFGPKYTEIWTQWWLKF